MFKKNTWIPILIVLLVVMGCGLFYSKRVANQEPVKIHHPVTGEPVEASKPPPPGQTAESGHWHGDEWHADEHDAHVPAEAQQPPPIKQSAAEDTPDTPQTQPQLPADFVNPTSTSSNPLFADGVPEHLQCPPELIGVYSREIDAETSDGLKRIGIEILEKWNPNRPLTEVYPAFIEAERWYHDNADPQRSGLGWGAGQLDWQCQLALDFPEIGVLAMEDPERSTYVRMVELGEWDPDHNMFELADGSGRTFRTDTDKKYVFTWGAFYRETEDGFESSDGFRHTSGPNNGDPNAEVIEINLDTVTDEELEELGGWNFNINPYTTGHYKLGDK